MFKEHGYKVGDRVRMVNVEAHRFPQAAEVMGNGEEGTVVRSELFLGIMPIFEVLPDNGKTYEYEGEETSVVPFGCPEDFSAVVKIEV